MNRRLSILMYHQIGPFAPMAGHRSTYCHQKRFARQMISLRLFGYRVLSLDEALSCLRGQRPTPGRAVVLTFDDGYQNFEDYAFPWLRKFEFPAMVYLLSGLLGQPADWFAEEGRDTPLLLSKERILSLRDQGVCFGSHGVNHVKLAEVGLGQAAREIETSRRDLENLLAEEVRHFCYPYGSYNQAVARIVKEAGYLSAATCLRAAADPAFDSFELPRKAISYGDSLFGFWWKLLFKNNPKTRPLLSAYQA